MNDSGGNMNKSKTKNFAILSMFVAIEILFVITPLGFIPLGFMNITTMHIPVILAGIVLGKKGGAQCGLVFGITSIINATLRPLATSFVFSPFVTVGGISGNFSSLIIAIAPRVLLGFVAGWLFEYLRKRMKSSLSAMISGVVASFTNTILVLGGIYIFFGDLYAQAIAQNIDFLFTFLLGIVATNGILEAILATIICLFAVRAIKV